MMYRHLFTFLLSLSLSFKCCISCLVKRNNFQKLVRFFISFLQSLLINCHVDCYLIQQLFQHFSNNTLLDLNFREKQPKRSMIAIKNMCNLYPQFKKSFPAVSFPAYNLTRATSFLKMANIMKFTRRMLTQKHRARKYIK